MTRDGPPLDDNINAASDRRGALLGETLSKSFPVADGGTLPPNVVQLMLILAHVEAGAETTGEALARWKEEKRSKLRLIAAGARGLVANFVRGRSRHSGSG